MEIIYLIAFIALIAIIFGVSMHQAFWGIIAFIVCGFFASIVVLFIQAEIERKKRKQAFYKTPEGQLVKQRKQELRKKDFMDDLSSALFLLTFFSPFLIAIVLATTFKEFSENNLLASMIICITPAAIVVASKIIMYKKRTK